LRSAYYSNSPQNLFGWQSAPFDELVNRARTTPNVQQRFELYHQADKILVQEEAAVIPLYYLQAYGLLRSPFKVVDAGKIIRDGNIKFKNIAIAG
jgi:oligopeptide transport system substrate-binding protein